MKSKSIKKDPKHISKKTPSSKKNTKTLNKRKRSKQSKRKKRNNKKRKTQKGSGPITKKTQLALQITMAVSVAAFSFVKKGLKKQISKQIQRFSRQTSNGDIEITNNITNSFQLKHSIPILDWSNIDINRIIGKGAFGNVSIGKYRDDSCVISESHITIKSLNTITDDNQSFDDYINECLLLDRAHRYHNKDGESKYNPHSVRLYGILIGQPDGPKNSFSIVSEYCQYGSLIQFIKKDCHGYITAPAVHLWSQQIADGMNYIAKSGIIHRDLAARNILIDALYNAKISDFGLSFMMPQNDKDEMISSSSFKVPVRWSSPSVLTKVKEFPGSETKERKLSLIWNETTDVWSYGIIIYEILTKGGLPYSEHKQHNDVIEHLTSDSSNNSSNKGPKLPPELKTVDSTLHIKAEYGGKLLHQLWNDIIVPLCFNGNDTQFDTLAQQIKTLKWDSPYKKPELLDTNEKFNIYGDYNPNNPTDVDPTYARYEYRDAVEQLGKKNGKIIEGEPTDSHMVKFTTQKIVAYTEL